MALALIAPDSDAGHPEYAPRAAVLAKLFEHYGERDTAKLERYIESLWHEVPVDWMALAVKRLIVERVYPSLPTVGDIRRVARALAGMDRTIYHAGRYIDSGHRSWPRFGLRHDVCAGTFEKLDVKRPLRLTPGAMPLLLTEGD
jgi:hypothetical protein